MKASRLVAPLVLLVVAIYLVATAPEALAASSKTERSLTTRSLFMVLANENDIARSLYTEEIVGPGKKIGLAFSEDWADPAVLAGPLPAVFLRCCAEIISKKSSIMLRLASDYPIELRNQLVGTELKRFQEMKDRGVPVFYVNEDAKRQVAMFPDIAVSMACVACHNSHEHSAKSDWALNDVMGATTWSWPTERISHKEALKIVKDFRGAVRTVYSSFVDKIRGVKGMPGIGLGWPADCISLPDPDQFLAECVKRASGKTLKILMADESWK